MKTLRLAVDASQLNSQMSQSSLQKAAAILRQGGTVAFPTETVYGLGANALDADAVTRIFVAKQRPNWDPLIVHVSDEAMLQRVAANLPDAADQLKRAFWPGPLTLLVPRSEAVPPLVTAGRERVGVRMPSHPVARATRADQAVVAGPNSELPALIAQAALPGPVLVMLGRSVGAYAAGLPVAPARRLG